MDGVITTVSGRHVDITQSPSDDSIDIEDIAHALSLQCRYNGQIKSFYSVADHCVEVANAVYKITRDKRKALEGLLHDAHEAYTGDLVFPIKKHFMDAGHMGFDFMEHYVAGVIMCKYGLPEVTTKTSVGRLYTPSEEVKDMDTAAYQHESFCFDRPDHNRTKYVELFSDLKESVPAQGKRRFLQAFRRYAHASRRH